MTKQNKIALLVMLFCPVFAIGQARVVLNNNGYIVIDNSAFVVLENSNPNAITTLGSGGNIVSEDETDVIKWEIGATIGTYVIPWTTRPVSQGGNGTKIPLSINKGTTGTGATSEFILSTWETATDFNIPIPSAVNNMNFNAVDKSLYVADRFWHIDALSYTVKPDVVLSIGYDPAANEIGLANTIVEANLLAQRFNTTLAHWESYLLFGTNNAPADRVDNIFVSAADFFEDWIIVDQTNPLPVELTNFEVNCVGSEVEIEWTTQTEVNNVHFVVEKSYDAVNFFELTVVQGAGTSNVANFYSVIDENPTSGVTYYRLKQVDFNSAINYHEIASASCNVNGFVVDHLVLNNNLLSFDIAATEGEELTIFFYDYRGRVISNKSQRIIAGNNTIKLNNLNLSTGIYMLSIVGEQNSYSAKLMNK